MRNPTNRREDARSEAIDRRSVLLGGLSLLGGIGVWARPGRAAAFAPAAGPMGERPRTLVLVQLSGGNDGLSTVVPYADDAYGRARQKTRIPGKEVLRIDDYRGLHPNLPGLRAMYDQGQLAIVEGVGHPGPLRSHFKAMDVWHAASEHGRVGGEGWIGRLANVNWSEDRSPELMVHVGSKTPYALYSSSRSPVAFEIPESYRWIGDQAEQRSYANYARSLEGRSDGSTLARLRDVLRDAQASSGRVRNAVAAYRPRVPYPDDPFGSGLRVIAAILDANMGARVLSIELGGFDTHQGQKAAHDRLMRTVDAGLSAFLHDLSGREVEQQVLVLAFSEFGRRVQENGSLGTDHGKAAPMFLAGAGVRGGLYGRHPSLEELNEGDLVHTTDFRSVYASVIEDWFGASSNAVLGADHPRLPLFRVS